MKKILFFLFLFVISFFVFTKIHVFKKAGSQEIHVVVAPSPTPMTVGLPVILSIPSLGIHANIESVGLDAQDRMGVPENSMDTAWYKYGYKPGEAGSAVIDGHFDTTTGAPAVFYSISKLHTGDTISVTDSNNKTYTFAVTQVTSYPYDQLPMQQIFATHDKPRLNLITCDGTWDRTAHNYSNRTVIYAEKLD